ncbi:MAG: C1 family peptidase [Candidatus Krumholzibacteriia bacterium]
MNQHLHRVALIGAVLVAASGGVAAAGDEPRPERRDQPVYRPANRYPVLEEIEAARATQQAIRDSLKAAADARHAAESERREDEARSLRVDLSAFDLPPSPEIFPTAWHTPPLPQYFTGTCWAFCSVSLLESEIQRRHGREVKLSEMWIVYHEYLEKSRRFLREYGHSAVAEGSQDHGTLEVMEKYGLVPAEAYRGVLQEDGRFDHEPLLQELKGYLVWVRDSGTWDEPTNLAAVRAILDRHLGSPPGRFAWRGREYEPESFRDEVVGLDADEYVSCVSRLDEPFGAFVLLDVPDNWRRRSDYLNLPLDAWYGALRGAVTDGYTVTLGGDVSEPGLDGHHDVAVIPSFDIPAAAIDQGAREFRIATRQTTDDHGVHAVGYVRHGGADWFLIKDSNRSSRLGRFEGYYFYHGDYVKLKTLAFLVHRDRLRDLLPQE